MPDEQMEQASRRKASTPDQPKPKCDSVMIDTETLGVRADAVILSIGAVKFVRNGDYIDDAAFYTALDFGSQTDRHINAETLSWWMGQSAEARQVFTDPVKMRLRDALSDLVAWIGDTNNMLVWSNGGDFDIPLINHALGTYNMPQLVKFWNNRCYRTMKSEYHMVPPPQREGAHNAMMDAIFQAKHLQAIYKFKNTGGIDVPAKGFSAKG